MFEESVFSFLSAENGVYFDRLIPLASLFTSASGLIVSIMEYRLKNGAERGEFSNKGATKIMVSIIKEGNNYFVCIKNAGKHYAENVRVDFMGKSHYFWGYENKFPRDFMGEGDYFTVGIRGYIGFSLDDIRVKVVWNDGSGVDRERVFQPSR